MTTSQPNDDTRRGAADDEPEQEHEAAVPADPQDPTLLQQYPDAADLPEPDAPSRRMAGRRDDIPRER